MSYEKYVLSWMIFFLADRPVGCGLEFGHEIMLELINKHKQKQNVDLCTYNCVSHSTDIVVPRDENKERERK